MDTTRSQESFDDKMRDTDSSSETGPRYRLLQDGERVNRSWTQKGRRKMQGRWWTVIALILTTVLSCVVGFFIGYQQRDLDDICTRHTSHYSSIQSAVPIKYHLERFNGSLLKENIFRQDPGPEVDAAWDSLGISYKGIVVPYDQAERSGIALDQVKINPKYGGGFPANVEGLHQLHCLNLLRQTLYYNYDYYHALGEGAFRNDDYIVKRHVTHCLDFIRQQLMCTADTGVLGQIWIYPENPTPFVDFNTEHRCRNFEDVRRWAEKHQMPDEPPEDYIQGPAVGDRIYGEIP